MYIDRLLTSMGLLQSDPSYRHLVFLLRQATMMYAQTEWPNKHTYYRFSNLLMKNLYRILLLLQPWINDLILWPKPIVLNSGLLHVQHLLKLHKPILLLMVAQWKNVVFFFPPLVAMCITCCHKFSVVFMQSTFSRLHYVHVLQFHPSGSSYS